MQLLTSRHAILFPGSIWKGENSYGQALVAPFTRAPFENVLYSWCLTSGVLKGKWHTWSK